MNGASANPVSIGVEGDAAALAVINSVQKAIGEAADFQSIVDVVGDKLREVFDTGDISINWWDEASDSLHYRYSYEHGVRLNLPPLSPTVGTAWHAVLAQRRLSLANTIAEQEAMGVEAVAGTDRALSIVAVPMVVGERTIGAVCLENHEREYAFGPDEIRLLQTITASMAVALENARLFDETQRLLKETEARNAELAIINSIQQAVGAELDFQGIVDTVGNKLREVFATGDMSIRWWDETTGVVHHLYSYEHGKRLPIRSSTPEPGSVPDRFYREEHTAAIVGSVEEQLAIGIPVQPGTDRARSILVRDCAVARARFRVHP